MFESSTPAALDMCERAMNRSDPLDQLLDATAARTPAPGGGAAAGLACALGAALAAMAARFAGREDDAARADHLRARALDLADADAAGYAPVLAALSLPREDPEREARLHAALGRAAEVPLALTETAAEVAELARRLAAEGKSSLRGDALTGADLAAAAARAAARLVAIDLEHAGADPRVERARAASERAAG
jgi:formiminotetrahydrofolate cyclodeaminase